CPPTWPPNSVISRLTSSRRSGLRCKVCRPSGVRVLNKIYVGIMLLLSGGGVGHPACLGPATTTSSPCARARVGCWDTGVDYREPARRLSSHQTVTSRPSCGGGPDAEGGVTATS